MRYVVLVYEDEERWAAATRRAAPGVCGPPRPLRRGGRRAGHQGARRRGARLGGDGDDAAPAAATPSSSPMGRSPRPPNSSAASTSSRRATSTRSSKPAASSSRRSRSAQLDTRTDPDPLAAAAVDWGRLLSLLIGQFRRVDLAEESLQEAFAAAARAWPARGAPTNPAAWLLTAARRRALDQLRAEAIEGAQAAAAGDQPGRQPAAAFARRHLADDRRRAAAADLHVLPSGVAAGRERGVDLATRRRPARQRDRSLVPRQRADDGRPD